ncbi:hypothetical protein BD626DRAFT_392804 [Schizophyllum amplum]|uniref:YCII-related domain-containing protein n=1 Tax=Schizophyllum amplum TaxID=97359 RepID=A0A550CZ77_9AGAR|nr:hypothetical protein BD626DRAFT_392804 [Auriculariopsis ampla]
MTTAAAAAKLNFLVYAPDRTEEGTFEKRMSVRPAHLENAASLISSGAGVVGALATPESANSPTKRMVGSVLIVEAESIEEVKAKVEADIYYTSDVWDKERLVILPFFPAPGIKL